jgi:hypothetical protein
MRIDNAGNVGVGISTPLSVLDVDGTSLIRGTNTNTPLTPVSALELFVGRDNAGALNTGQTVADIAIQGGLSGGGYKHFISTRHMSAASDNRNSINFYLNNSATAAGSSAVGTGNINGLTITPVGTGILNATPTSTLTVTGSLSLPFNSTGAANLTVTSVMHTINCNNAGTAITVTLPTPASITGRIYRIKRDVSSTGTVTVGTAAGQVQAFAGTFAATTTLGALGSTSKCLVYQSDGTNWHLIN